MSGNDARTQVRISFKGDNEFTRFLKSMDATQRNLWCQIGVQFFFQVQKDQPPLSMNDVAALLKENGSFTRRKRGTNHVKDQEAPRSEPRDSRIDNAPSTRNSEIKEAPVARKYPSLKGVVRSSINAYTQKD